MNFSFNMSPLAFYTKHGPCLSAWTIKKISAEGMAAKKKGKSALVGCNAICCFRKATRGCLSGSRVRCLGAKQLRVWKQSAETWKYEREHTQGSDNPWADGDGQVSRGERFWGVAMFMPLVSGKEYKSITPCATFGLCKSPGVQELKRWWWLEIQLGLPSISATKIDRIAAYCPPLQPDWVCASWDSRPFFTLC